MQQAHFYIPRSTTLVTFCWMWSISLSLPPLTGWGSYRPEKNGMSCAPSWSDKEDTTYNIFLFSVGFFLPLVIIITTSLSVIRSIHQNISTIISSDIKKAALDRQYKVVKMVREQSLATFSFLV
jgi:hypothetical protein